MEQNEQTNAVTAQGWWLRLVHHRRGLMAAIFCGWALVTAVGWFLPARYRSETLILVEQQRVPEHYVEPNVAVDLQQRLQSMSEEILSRTRLIGIIEKFHLYSRERERRPDMDAVVERMRKDIGIDLVKGENAHDQITAFKVSYSADSALVAQQVTAELTSLFIDENLRNREQLSEDTTAFLENQLDEARKNLDQQELRLKEFKSRYLGQLPEQNTSNLQILNGLQSKLQNVTDALNQAEQQRLYLQSMLNEYRAMRPNIGTGEKNSSLPSGYELAGKLEGMKSQLAELSAKYTPLHPDIIRLKEEIAATEKLKAAADEQLKSAAKNPAPAAAASVSSAPGDLQTMSPILQLESQLKANEFEATKRKAEIKKVESDIDLYQQRLNLAPAREQELAAITRDHEQSRTYYESLLAKKNQSEMATNLEKRQQGEQFRMIDPPSLAQKPYFPNRLMFSLGGLGFGIALGVGLVLLIEIGSPKIYAREDLPSFGTAFLVTVPPMPTPDEKLQALRHRIAESIAAAAIVTTIPLVTLLMYYKG